MAGRWHLFAAFCISIYKEIFKKGNKHHCNEHLNWNIEHLIGAADARAHTLVPLFNSKTAFTSFLQTKHGPSIQNGGRGKYRVCENV